MTDRIKGIFELPGLGRITVHSASVPDRKVWDSLRVNPESIPCYSPAQAIQALKAITNTERPINPESKEAKELRKRNQLMGLVPDELKTRITTKVVRRLFTLSVQNIPDMAEVADDFIKVFFKGGVFTPHTAALRTLAQEELARRC